ncbi:GNAT family N-acetyltransferase [Christensenellaceae bacterium OttesenSCG-928-K19]|nr:GNAT family N-acetyltransferase [Christensenellaceae bacterium OttesenSCG-928-K19]
MELIELKKATEQDAPDVLAITQKAFALYAKEVRKREKIAALYETLDDVLFDIRNKYVYIAKIDGETVGSVRFHVMRNNIAYLSRFSMLPDVQNLGIGGLLLEKVKLECVALGVRAITLHTASKMRSTVAFYLKNGYYIHSISRDSDYIRAFMVNELVEMDEMFDYEAAVAH